MGSNPRKRVYSPGLEPVLLNDYFFALTTELLWARVGFEPRTSERVCCALTTELFGRYGLESQEEMEEYRVREEGALRREANARFVELAARVQSHMPALLADCLVMKIHKLSAEQRARLFHWRFD